jgi:hypothetical protein
MPRLIYVTGKLKGGPGSGHRGHAGRPGSRGGSASRGAVLSLNLQAEMEHMKRSLGTAVRFGNVSGRIVGFESTGVLVGFGDKKRGFISPASLTVEKSPAAKAVDVESFVRDKVMYSKHGQLSSDISEQDRERMIGLLSQHTPQALGTVNAIRIATDSASFLQEYANVARDPGGGKSAVAFFDPIHKVVVLRNRYGDDTIHHEIGHGVFRGSRVMSRKSWDVTYKNPAFDRFTSYSETGGSEEAFCESYASYIKAGSGSIDDRHQQSYDAVKRVIDGIR